MCEREVEIMTIGERIKLRRQELELSVDDIAKKLDKNRATVYRYESAEIENLPITVLEPLAKVLKTTPAYLMGWEEDVVYPANIFPIEKKKIPMLGSIAAGTPIFAEEKFEFYVEIGAEIKADFCLKVRGDSMINARIHDGDLVFIRQQPQVKDGEIAAVLVDDEATLKRVYIQKSNITLLAENPKYSPLVYHKDQQHNLIILGLAVAFQSDVK
jgi:repressor LexA